MVAVKGNALTKVPLQRCSQRDEDSALQRSPDSIGPRRGDLLRGLA